MKTIIGLLVGIVTVALMRNAYIWGSTPLDTKNLINVMGVDSTCYVCILCYAIYGFLGGSIMDWFTFFGLAFLCIWCGAFLMHGANHRAGVSAILAVRDSSGLCAIAGGVLFMRYAIDCLYVYFGR